MAFRLTDEQWATIKQCIDKLGGYEALDHLRITIEEHLTAAFISPNFDAELAISSQEAHKKTEELRDIIDHLAKLRATKASQMSCHDCYPFEVANERAKSLSDFADFLSIYTDELRQDVASLSDELEQKKRGRPTDKAVPLLCHRILETARHEKWMIIDSRGRTSEALLDLMVALMKCAKDAKLTVLERERRAFVNALGDARKEQAGAREANSLLQKELDFLAQAAPDNAGSGPN